MEETFKDEQQERIEFLLKEYDDHRDAIKSMIYDLEKIRTKVDTLIPDRLDNRYMRFFEEKVKSITGLFNSLLEMRKEIAKSVKDEIEIRRRIKSDDELIDIEDMLDVRSMAEKIDKFKDETDKIRKKRSKAIKDQTIDEEIEIPGLTDEKGRKIE
jgi:hypothetical protein